MSTYSNEPQQTNWEIWFIISIILLISMMIWGINSQPDSLPVIYDGLLLATFANLVYCIIYGIKN